MDGGGALGRQGLELPLLVGHELGERNGPREDCRLDVLFPVWQVADERVVEGRPAVLLTETQQVAFLKVPGMPLMATAYWLLTTGNVTFSMKNLFCAMSAGDGSSNRPVRSS